MLNGVDFFFRFPVRTAIIRHFVCMHFSYSTQHIHIHIDKTQTHVQNVSSIRSNNLWDLLKVPPMRFVLSALVLKVRKVFFLGLLFLKQKLFSCETRRITGSDWWYWTASMWFRRTKKSHTNIVQRNYYRWTVCQILCLYSYHFQYGLLVYGMVIDCCESCHFDIKFKCQRQFFLNWISSILRPFVWADWAFDCFSDLKKKKQKSLHLIGYITLLGWKRANLIFFGPVLFYIFPSWSIIQWLKYNTVRGDYAYKRYFWFFIISLDSGTAASSDTISLSVIKNEWYYQALIAN